MDLQQFKNIKRNPTEEIKRKLNKIIKKINKTRPQKLNKLTGDYKPGYIHGTVKTHKLNNPLRPIISQIPTPTYEIAKTTI